MAEQDSTLLTLMDRLKAKAPEYVDLMVAENDEVFEAAFDSLLEKAVHGLEKNSKNFSGMNEEGLTATLALALGMPGLSISQEEHSNGHVDITIETHYCFPMRTKLGEAKIYDGPEKHVQGLCQLLNRYTTGREGRGLLITYVRKANIEGLMQKLRTKMDEDLPVQQQGKTADHPSDWRFLSRHAHSCGKVLEIGHIGCNLFVAGPHALSPAKKP